MGSLGLALYYMEELLKLLEPLFYMEESSLGGGWEVVGRWLGAWLGVWLGAVVGSPGWEPWLGADVLHGGVVGVAGVAVLHGVESL